MIDIGGPTMIRAAAKNFRGVAVIVDPDDYTQVLAALEDGERTVPEPLRRGWRSRPSATPRPTTPPSPPGSSSQSAEAENRFPRHLLLDLARELELRYGENPHQEAARLPGARAAAACSAAWSSSRARSCRSTTCSTSTPRASLVALVRASRRW